MKLLVVDQLDRIGYEMETLDESFPGTCFLNRFADAESLVQLGSAVDVALINPILEGRLNQQISRGVQLMRALKSSGARVIYADWGMGPDNCDLEEGRDYDSRHQAPYQPEELVGLITELSR